MRRGCPSGGPFYLNPGDPARVAAAIGALPLEYETGTRVVYSDPNFIAARPRARAPRPAARSTRSSPSASRARSGSRDTGFRPDPSLRRRIAASETGNAVRAADVRRRGRPSTPAGARTSSGAKSTTGTRTSSAASPGTPASSAPPREVACVARQFLPGGRCSSATRRFELFRTNLTPGLEEHRSIGWMLASTPDSAAGPALAPDAFGHLGFTGTSVWVDPATPACLRAAHEPHPPRPPRPALQRNPAPRPCAGCGGAGRARVDRSPEKTSRAGTLYTAATGFLPRKRQKPKQSAMARALPCAAAESGTTHIPQRCRIHNRHTKECQCSQPNFPRTTQPAPHPSAEPPRSQVFSLSPHSRS